MSITRCIAISLFLVLLPGCLERKETIKVARDGSVELTVELSGDRSDMDVGDALPSQRGGWQMRDWTDKDSDGKEKYHRAGRLRVAENRPLPDSYADSGEPGYKTALNFPTEVTVERRPDGTYYHFRRVYRGRENARYDYYRQAIQESGVLKDAQGKNPADLTDEERRALLTTLQSLEGRKRAEFVQAGVEALEEHWPQHYGLLLRKTTIDHFANVDVGPVLELMTSPESPQRDAAINEFATRQIARVRDALQQELRRLRVPPREMAAFFEAYDEEDARRSVSEDVADELWKVRVELPGELVAHNGAASDGNAVTWEFQGKALMDRNEILMATSRVR